MFRFTIHDIIESIQETENNEERIIRWKPGVKSGVAYLIHIRTGDKGASLNFRFGSACLTLKLYGDSGISNEILLNIPMEQTFYLQPNQTDTFEINSISTIIGQINSIDLYHNGSNKQDSWCIDWMDIKDITTNKSYRFDIL